MTHRTPISVRFSEVDPYQHVNHAVYVVYFEEGRTAALAGAGLDLGGLQEQGFQIVITELEVRYRAPARLGDLLVVETGVEEIGASATRFRQRVVHEDGRLMVEARVRGALTDMIGRPRRMPPGIVERLRTLVAPT